MFQTIAETVSRNVAMVKTKEIKSRTQATNNNHFNFSIILCATCNRSNSPIRRVP